MRLPPRGWCATIVCALSFLFLSAPAFSDPFTDVTLKAGVGDKGRGKGVAWADVDGDGYLDIFVSNKGGPSRLFLHRS